LVEKLRWLRFRFSLRMLCPVLMVVVVVLRLLQQRLVLVEISL
jgi:hypothetical protein